MSKKSHGVIRCKHDEMAAIETLTLNSRNPNKHSPGQIAVYAHVLKASGVRQPVRISKLSGLVTKGHGQIEASKLNEWTHVPVEFQDYESEAQEYADLVADNALGHQSELDYSQINMDLPDFGPELKIEDLGIKDFAVDPADKTGRSVSFTAGEPKKIRCPNCDHEF